MKIPDYVSTNMGESVLHSFLRHHRSDCWLKGPYYEAVRVRSWAEINTARKGLLQTWDATELFLQEHIQGHEWSIAFCALDGRLRGAIEMIKCEKTLDGKAWAGQVAPLSPSFEEAIRAMLLDLGWTGGGELEMIRDATGTDWLMECNPRFPAWIHGATLSGVNLPQALVNGTVVPEQHYTALSETSGFGRVVLELPIDARFPLQRPAEPFSRGIIISKHPSGMPELSRKLKSLDRSPQGLQCSGKTMPTDIEELSGIDPHTSGTPIFIYRESAANKMFDSFSGLQSVAEAGGHELLIGYSVKTNPDPRLLKVAQQRGMLAECISRLEIEAAIAAGFHEGQLLLNGPAKWWPVSAAVGVKPFLAYCDSVEELEQLLQTPIRPVSKIGIRLRPPQANSRFGISVDTPDALNRLIGVIKRDPGCVTACHMHLPSSVIGIDGWIALFRNVIDWCSVIQYCSDMQVDTVDIGGGWVNADVAYFGSQILPLVQIVLREKLPSVKTLIVEPGKALSQSAFGLLSTVLEVRNDGGSLSVVCDASVAELPEILNYPHPLIWWSEKAGRWQVIGSGNDSLYGRLCMEYDVLGVRFAMPHGLVQGDKLLFLEVGAYDKSMSYQFGTGRS